MPIPGDPRWFLARRVEGLLTPRLQGPSPKASNPVSLGWASESVFPTRSPSDADAVGPRTTLPKPLKGKPQRHCGLSSRPLQ